jgi:hypothetical protein
MDMATMDELERRLRFVEADIASQRKSRWRRCSKLSGMARRSI